MVLFLQNNVICIFCGLNVVKIAEFSTEEELTLLRVTTADDDDDDDDERTTQGTDVRGRK